MKIRQIQGRYLHPSGMAYENPYVLYEGERPIIVDTDLERLLKTLPVELLATIEDEQELTE